MQTEHSNTWLSNGKLTPTTTTRAHHRESSLSSLGSAGPSSPYTANTSNPQVAGDIYDDFDFYQHPSSKPLTPVYTPKQEDFLKSPYSNYSKDYRPSPLNFDTPTDREVAHLPHTQQEATITNYGYGALPKLDRTMTDVYSDELYNPYFRKGERNIGGSKENHLPPPLISPQNETFTQALQEVKYGPASHMRAQEWAERDELSLQQELECITGDEAMLTTMSPPEIDLESKDGVTLQSDEDTLQSKKDNAIEMLARENEVLRQHQYNARTRPLSSTGSAFGLSDVHGFQETLPEESDYAIDGLEEINELQERASKGLPGRRMSQYGATSQPRVPPPENRKSENTNIKNGYWQSSLGFGGSADIPQSRLPEREEKNTVAPDSDIVFLKKNFYRKDRLTEGQALHICKLGTAILGKEPILQKDSSNVITGQSYDHLSGSIKSSETSGCLDPFDELELADEYRRAEQTKNVSVSQRTWRHGDPSPPPLQGTLRENKRKVLRLLIRGKEHLSCPDSGSSENIMNEDFALKQGFRIHPKTKRFQMGNGKYKWSTGKVYTSITVPGLLLTRKKRSFFVLSDCPVPLIMGLPFLEEAEIMSKNRHVLESCPSEWKTIPHLLSIGSPRNRMRCSFGGHELTGVADTGSDLNFMSLNCAKREGFDIDQREHTQRRIQCGDGTVAETVGQVYVYNLGFDWSLPETEPRDATSSNSENSLPSTTQPEKSNEDHYETFHVFPNLPSDLVFGRDLLERLNAFNLCPELSADKLTKKRKPAAELPVPELNILINLGASLFSSSKKRKRNNGNPTHLVEKEKHDSDRHAEFGRRSRREDEIAQLPQTEQAQARRVETENSRAWDNRHARCIHCSPVN